LDRNTLETELARLHPASLSWARCCCRGNAGEAEDVLQTTYLKIMDGRARFDGRSSLKTWLFSVIRMTARERRRKAWHRGGLVIEWLAELQVLAPTEAPATEELYEGGETRSRVARALARLPARQREALELVFYHDLTIAEAGQAMRVSLGTARVHYERGKKELRRILGEGRPGDE
jgi:RNA polymerase sigma factor (sigma-70 family)